MDNNELDVHVRQLGGAVRTFARLDHEVDAFNVATLSQRLPEGRDPAFGVVAERQSDAASVIALATAEGDSSVCGEPPDEGSAMNVHLLCILPPTNRRHGRSRKYTA